MKNQPMGVHGTNHLFIHANLMVFLFKRNSTLNPMSSTSEFLLLVCGEDSPPYHLALSSRLR